MVEKYYTIQEVVKILGITRPTLYNWEKNGKISMIRLSSQVVRISETELNRFLKERQNG